MKATLLVWFAAALAAAPLSAQEFPLRAKYVEEKYISTPELMAALDNSIIIDSRDETEFDVIHIARAQLIPVDKMKQSDLTSARDGNKKLVFYCNGVLCEKSYRAAQMSRLWGYQNSYVYDAGIFDWATHAPEKTIVFGNALTKETAKTALISPQKFEAACLLPDAFKAKAADPAYKIFDIRDRSDRARVQVKFRDDVGANIDEFVGFLRKGVVVPREKILIYDNVGKQVVWLQYYLEHAGVKEYYFLKGGVRALGR